MTRYLILRRWLSVVVGLMVCCSIGPILGFNVYFNALKAQFSLTDTTGISNGLILVPRLSLGLTVLIFVMYTCLNISQVTCNVYHCTMYTIYT